MIAALFLIGDRIALAAEVLVKACVGRKQGTVISGEGVQHMRGLKVSRVDRGKGFSVVRIRTQFGKQLVPARVHQTRIKQHGR